MKLIGPRARSYGDLPARGATKLRRIGRRLNPKFLQSIYRHQAVRSALSGEAPDRACKGTPGLEIGVYADVRAHAIHHPVVRTRALAVDAKLSRIESISGS